MGSTMGGVGPSEHDGSARTVLRQAIAIVQATWREVLVIAALLALAATSLQAQAPVFGVGFVQGTNPPQPLFDVDDCPGSKAWAGEATLGARFSRIATIEVVGGYNWANPNTCVVGPPPIPPTGEFSFSSRTTTGGYPYWNTDARLVFESPEPRSSVWLRAFGGYGRMWGKDIGYWVAGGGIVLGGQLQTILDAEWNWFSVPFDQTTLNFEDGALVSTDRTSGSTSHNMFRLRAGFRWSP